MKCMLWYETEKSKIKVATHACFDKGMMSNLPVPPNVAHPICTDNGQPILPDIAELTISNFAFDVVPFVPIFTG